MKKFNKIRDIYRLSDEVHRQILEAVSSRLISPRDRIVQEDLADMMGVSRTPVRDALLRLESEGVLVRVGRKGFHLRSFTFEEVEQLYRAREAVECYAFGRLSQQLNGDDISRLKVTIEELERGPRGYVMDYFNANRTIHREFVVQVKNPFLVEMFDSIWNRGGVYIFVFGVKPGRTGKFADRASRLVRFAQPQGRTVGDAENAAAHSRRAGTSSVFHRR